MEIKLVNLTPHELTLVREDGSKVTIPPSGVVARVKAQRIKAGELNGFPVFKTVFGEVEGLPEPREGTIYVVSSLVLQALSGRRKDVVAPDTSPEGAVRDSKGQIIGVRGFQTL